MIKNYLKIAWRNLVKSPTISFINIMGLAIGIAVTIMIGLWVNNMISYNDYFPNKERVVQFYQNQTINGKVRTGQGMPIPLGKAIRNGHKDNFKHLVMSSWTEPRYLSYGEINISKKGNFMQEEAPDLLHLEILSGVKNGLVDINSIMLSASAANALFGTENPINKIVTFNSAAALKVTAIYKDIPENNHFNAMDFIVPWKKYVSYPWISGSVGDWGNNSFQLFAELADNVSIINVMATIKDVKLNATKATGYNPQLFLHPMEDWYLKSQFRNGVQNGGRIQLVWLFGVIGVFVLFLACINFMNLSTARSEKRAKEVGIRKSIGSARSQLITQFLTESFLVVMLAFIIALLMVVLLITPFNNIANTMIVFPWSNAQFWLGSLFFIMMIALFSGSYPAVYLSSFKPVKVLKGTFKVGHFASLPRKVLVVLQFTVSVTLIIGTILILRQIEFGKNRPIGYDKEGLVQIPVGSSDFNGKYNFMRTVFINSGAVMEMSSSTSPTTAVFSNRSGYTWEGKPDGFQESIAWSNVSPEWAKSLNLKIVEGRDFSRKMATDSNAVLINQTAVKYMGLTNPIGMFIRNENQDEANSSPAMQIIGVVEDMIIQSPYEPTKQAWYVFDKGDNASYYNLRLNPNKSASANMEIIEDVFKKHFPNIPFQYDFVDVEYGKKFALEEQIGNLASIFTLLAILISCLGIFGLASFMAEQRTKEMGIRKVLGASIMNLWALLSKDFVILVLISLCIAIPLAWYFMDDLLSRYTYRAEFSWWIFAIAGLGALVITLLTVSYQSIKAAMTNPVKSLRTE